MKRGDARTIAVDGKEIEATYLGKGRHATAYRAGDTVYLFVFDEGEHMKEALALFGPDDSPHVPKITTHEEQHARGKYLKVYSMPFYRNITAKDADAWKILKTLADAAERIIREKYMFNEKPLHQWGQYFMNDVIDATRGQIPDSVTEALQSIADAGANYGMGIAFEFGKRNIGVDDAGNIVFRDIIFDSEKIHKEMMTVRRRFGG